MRRRRGAAYLLHFEHPYQHAGHYLGFAYPGDPGRAGEAALAEIRQAMQTRVGRYHLTAEQAAGVAARIAQHRAGNGARLMAVIAQAGIGFRVTRIWAGATEGTEKWLKDRNDRRVLCPECTPGTRAAMNAQAKRSRRPRSRRPAPEAVITITPVV